MTPRILRTRQEVAEHVARKRGNMPVTGFAKAIGVSRATAYSYIDGTVPADAANLKSLGLERAVIATDESPLEKEKG